MQNNFDLFHTLYSSLTADNVRDVPAVDMSNFSYLYGVNSSYFKSSQSLFGKHKSEGRSESYRGCPEIKYISFRANVNKKTASVWFL